MAVKRYKPTSAARRLMTVHGYAGDLTKGAKAENSLLEDQRKSGGRNNQGKITVRHIGGGNKRKYRIIDFKRNKDGVPATVKSIQYDPNRSANIALLVYADGEMRYIPIKCKATIGQVGNLEHEIIRVGKAGKTRHFGTRPTVRGSVMNPNDHPHGGGEGKSPVGHAGPETPWGKPALGYKTRKKKNPTSKFILKRIN